MSNLWKTITRGLFTIGSVVAKILQPFMDQVMEVIRNVSDWIRENQELIQAMLKIAAVATGAGAALMLLGKILPAIGVAFNVLATAITIAWGAIGSIISIMGAMLSPIGLVVAAIAGVGAGFLVMSGKGAEAVSSLKQGFTSLKETAVTAWGGIVNAIKSGDLGLAMKIAWLTVKLLWAQGIAFLKEKWLNFKEYFVRVGADAFFGLLKFASDLWAGIQSGFVDLVAAIETAFVQIIGAIKNVWFAVQRWITKKFIWVMSLFDKTIDVEKEQARIDKDPAQKRRDEELNKQLAAIQKERAEMLGQIAEESDKRRQSIEDRASSYFAQRDALHRYEVRKAKETADKIAKEWQEAIREAREKSSGKKPPTPDQPGYLSRHEEEKKKKDEEFEQQKFEAAEDAANSVAGTFSAIGARGLGHSTVFDRISKATQQTADNTYAIRRKIGFNDLTFGD